MPAPAGGRRAGRTALVLIALSVLLQVLVGRLGTSVAVPPLRPDQVGEHPADPWLATGLLAVALTVGAVGVYLGLRALRSGWTPAPVRLLAGAAIAVIILLVGPPLGTADLGSYAAYGRMAVLDRNPYTTTPRQLAGDPVADAAEEPWRDLRSIYGPVATAEFHLAAELGGTSRQSVLRLLAGAAGLAFIATGLLLDRLCRWAGNAGRRRAVLLWSLNPLLLHQLVAGAHLDALLTVLTLAGVAVLIATRTGGDRPDATSLGRSALSGALLGLAALVKATAAAPAAGLAAAHLLATRGPQRPAALRRFAAYALVGVMVVAVGYGAAGGGEAVGPTRDASRFVSRGTPWRYVASGLEQVLPQDLARTLVGLVAVVTAAWLAARIHRALPDDPEALRCALAASVAWVVVAPYSLPWYDAVAWALLALLSLRPLVVVALESLLLLHTAALSVAYLPGRVVGLPHGLVLAQDVVRGGVAPVVVLGVVLGLARLDRLSAKESPSPPLDRPGSRTAGPALTGRP